MEGYEKLNPLTTNDAYMCHENFSFMMSLPAMSLGGRFYMSRKGKTGERGWVYPHGEKKKELRQ